MGLVFSRDAQSAEDGKLREALALSIDRESMNNVLLQGGGEPAGTLLPGWMSGYAFLFPTAIDLQRARQARDEVQQAPVWTLGYDASDPLARVIAERIALNARDAGLTLQTTATAAADMRLVRMPLPSLDAWVALSELAGEAWDCRSRNSMAIRASASSGVRSGEHSAAIAARDSPAAFANRGGAWVQRDGLAGRSGWQLAFAGRLAGNGEALSFRRKLLLVFALTVFLCVGAVTWIVSSVTRRAFERANEAQTTALIAQFRREFSRRGDEVARRVETIAGSDAATRMALAVSRGSADYSAYVNEAKALADNQQLDFLEFVDSSGTILSSAQWPAKFGYKESSLPAERRRQAAFLRQEELPEGAALSLSAIRRVEVGDKPSS